MNDPEINALLGRGTFTAPEADRLFASIHAAVKPKRARMWWWAGVPALGLAVALLFVVPNQFADKGAPTTSATVECEHACAPGDRLIFSVSAASAGVLAAYGESPSGASVWYFPSDDGVSPEIAAGTHVVPRAVIVGHDEPGPWTVHLFVLPQAKSREAIQPSDETARVSLSLGEPHAP